MDVSLATTTARGDNQLARPNARWRAPSPMAPSTLPELMRQFLADSSVVGTVEAGYPSNLTQTSHAVPKKNNCCIVPSLPREIRPTGSRLPDRRIPSGDEVSGPANHKRSIVFVR